MNKYDVIVVGAGPAGMLAAGRAAELGGNVLLLEKMRSEGRKLLLTGKGRCNITNYAAIDEFIAHINPDGRFLRNAFSQFFSDDIIELINRHGVETVLERGGRYFPASNRSADVLKAIMRWLRKLNIKMDCNSRVEKLIVENSEIKGVLANGIEYRTRNVILSTGGKSYPATGSNGDGYKISKDVGHTITKIRPALVPLQTAEDIAQQVDKLNLRNIRVTVWINNKKAVDKFGELTFTDFGLSGPVILTISRLVVDELLKKNQVVISIDLKPALDDKKLDNRLQRDLNDFGKSNIRNVFRKWMPAALVPVFVDLTGISAEMECNQVSAKLRKKIRLLLKDLRFRIESPRSFDEAIITAGGIPTKEISSKTMESKIIKGLYFAGEIIDLDADTGGYNLQIAFSTGWLAGNSCMLDIAG